MVAMLLKGTLLLNSNSFLSPYVLFPDVDWDGFESDVLLTALAFVAFARLGPMPLAMGPRTRAAHAQRAQIPSKAAISSRIAPVMLAIWGPMEARVLHVQEAHLRTSKDRLLASYVHTAHIPGQRLKSAEMSAQLVHLILCRLRAAQTSPSVSAVPAIQVPTGTIARRVLLESTRLT